MARRAQEIRRQVDAERTAPAFARFDPYVVKHEVADPFQVERTHPVYFNLQESFESWVQALTDLPPRQAYINAAGRIEHGQQAVELLLSHDLSQAEQIGLRIDKNNSHRQDLDKEITRQALGLFEEESPLRDAWTTVLFNKDWHKGVVGIVASRLIETHYRPTVVLTESNGKASGSARSSRPRTNGCSCCSRNTSCSRPWLA